MVYDDNKDGRSIRGDDDLEIHQTDDRWEVVRIRGAQREQTALRTFDDEAAARRFQNSLMAKAGGR